MDADDREPVTLAVWWMPAWLPLGCAVGALSAVGWACGASPGLALALSAMLLVPGAALFACDDVGAPARWLAGSAALLTLAFLWAGVAAVPLRPPALLGGLLIAALVAIWRRRGRVALRIDGWLPAGLALTALIAALRVAQLAPLDAPAWVDGVHHTLLVRIAAERGLPPWDPRPYLPFAPLAYHWGYHVIIAGAALLGGASAPPDLPQTMLAGGQVLGVAAAVAWGSAAAALWQRRSAGVIALALVGVVSIMPAYYVSWGRYTLLCGLALAPGLLCAAWQPAPRRLIDGARLSLLLAGLSLVHLPLTLLVGVGALLLRLARRRAGVLLGASLGSALLTAPWLGLLLANASTRPGDLVGNPWYNQLPAALLYAASNPFILAIAALAGCYGIARRRRLAAALVLWCAGAVLLANPTLIGLPYLALVTNELLAITLFAPAALLIGGSALLAPRRRLTRLIIGALLIGITAQSAWGARDIVRRDTIGATRDDLAALAWLAGHTPGDARIAVNAAPWLGHVARGADGGWWALPLSGRQTSVPPVVYSYAPGEIAGALRREAAAISLECGDAASAVARARQAGYTHLYASDRGTCFVPAALASLPGIERVFANATVAIYAIHRGGSGP
ncbi:MAG: hypothetical protein KGS47_08000 [Chloroflexi bacterium]|nr:hypothetical protein [Chloroflexota bacterium]